MHTNDRDALLEVVRAAEAVLAAREVQMLTSEEWDALEHAVAEATQPPVDQREETFAVEDGHLVRRVVPARGQPYEHRCPLAIYRELVWSAIDLAADGFTLESLVESVRNRTPQEHDDRETWPSSTNAAVAVAFWKERGIIDTRRRRNYVGDGCFFEDAMIEYHALAETA